MDTGDGLSEGTSTASAEGLSTAEATGTSDGTSTASAEGGSIAVATGTSTCTSTADAEGTPLVTGDGSSTATSTADAVAIPPSDGVAAGVATADAVSIPPSDGVSAGTSTADAEGASAATADGVSDGTSTAAAFSISTTTGVGTAAGVATVTGVAVPPAIGTASGVATVQGYALVTSVSVGTAHGSASVLGISLTTVVNVESVDVIARDMIEVVFSQALIVNDALQDPETYTIDHSAGDGVAVIIHQVIVPAGRSATSVRLIITPFTIGEPYWVIVEKDVLRATAGDFLTTDNAHEFIGRETKVDRLVSNRPAMYDTTPGSVIRCLLDAIGRSDDLIGGSRQDRILGPVDSDTL